MKIQLPFSDILPCGVCSFSDVGLLLECRAKLRIPANSASVIVYLFPYWLGEEFYRDNNVSKYAVPADYHTIVGEYLEKISERLRKAFPGNKFEWFCDNSPIDEVRAASMCGLGVRGKNGLLINKKYGSFCFIGEIVTDLVVEYDAPDRGACLQCGACEKKCPGLAICDKGVQKTKCLSDITQRKGELSEREKTLIKNSGYIWGCDVCQDVCPMNKNIPVTPVREFAESAVPFFEKGGSLENRAYSWRGPRVIERNLALVYDKK